MKLFTKVLAIVAAISCVNVTAQAQEVWGKGGGVSYSMAGIEGGFRWNSVEAPNAESSKQVIGFQIGGSAVFDLAETFGIKTGLFYTERSFKHEAPGIVGNGKFTYFDVPVFAMFKFADYAGIYAGPTVSVKLGDELTSEPAGSYGGLTGVKGIVVPLTLGAQFKMTPGVGLNLFFETIPGELAKGLEGSKAVGANMLFTFE